jgi:hypothetical protein
MRLVTLGLEGQPAAEVIPATVKVWAETICRNRVFDRVTDDVRIREAFRVLAETCRRWPVPRDFIDALPRPTNVTSITKRLPSEQTLATGKAHIDALRKRLAIRDPDGDDDTTPPVAA